MIQSDQDKFSALFTNILMYSGIEYSVGDKGCAYVVYDNRGISFSISYNRFTNEYTFRGYELFKSEYAKYGLPDNASPSPQKVFDSVAFAYKIRNTVVKARQNVSVIYNDILIDSDIVFQMRGDFETYMVMNAGYSGYAICHREKDRTYGFKRYELVNTLYKICEIPMNKKPDFAALYKRTKDAYMAQVAIENIQHLYEI